MAEVHNAVRYGTDIVKGVGVAAGLDLSYAGVERLGETLTPVLDVWSRPEWSFLRNEWLWTARAQVGAVVGEGSMAAIVNPGGSNRIVVVTTIGCAAATAGTGIFVGLATEAQIGATLSVGQCTSRDTRRIPNTNGYANVGTQIAQGTDPTIAFNSTLDQQTSISANEFRAMQSVPWVLKAGHAVWCQLATANQAATFTFTGYERVTLPGEFTI